MNVRTGSFERTFESATAKALCMPAKKRRMFVYDVSYLRANSNFVYGGDFEQEQLEVTIRKAELPGFEIKQSTIVVIDGTVYLIHSINADRSPGQFFWQLVVTRSDKMDVGSVVIRNLVASVTFTAASPTVVVG